MLLNRINLRSLLRLTNGRLMKGLLLGGALVLVTGCSQNSSLGVVGKSLELAFVGHPDAEFDRQYVESIPYDSLILKIGMGPKSLVVHSKTENGNKHWVAADYTLYVTREGRVVKTGNLPINRVGFHSLMLDPIKAIERGAPWDYEYAYEVDIQPGNYIATPVKSRFYYLGEEDITILDEVITTKKYKEVFESEKLYWQGENFFWFDGQNRLRQTLQFVDPTTPEILTQVTR